MKPYEYPFTMAKDVRELNRYLLRQARELNEHELAMQKQIDELKEEIKTLKEKINGDS